MDAGGGGGGGRRPELGVAVAARANHRQSGKGAKKGGGGGSVQQPSATDAHARPKPHAPAVHAPAPLDSGPAAHAAAAHGALGRAGWPAPPQPSASAGWDDAVEADGPDGREAGGASKSFVDSPIFDAVIKVYCTHTEPDFSLPWQRKRQYTSTSSGFVIPGRRLLTNAHSVEHHTQVKVKRRGDDSKFVAQVLSVGHECDIALLTVADEAFWEGIQPLTLGPLPALQEAVAVVGYPVGGDTISVTSGVVSRIEVTPYAHGATELLGIQIDAAIK